MKPFNSMTWYQQHYGINRDLFKQIWQELNLSTDMSEMVISNKIIKWLLTDKSNKLLIDYIREKV